MKKSVIEKLNAILEEIERRVVNNVAEDKGSVTFFMASHQDHQAVLYFRDVFAKRYAEQPKNAHLCRDKALEMLDKLIEHHSLRRDGRWPVIDHLVAAESLKSIRDHLDRCYEIRSCD